MNAQNVTNLLLYLILANQDFVLPVVINITKKEPYLFILNFLNILIDMLFGLFLKNEEDFLEKIALDLIIFLKQHLLLLNFGLNKNTKRKILLQHIYQYFILMEEVLFGIRIFT